MDTKNCSGCQKTKSTKEFNFKDKKRKLYHSRCRSCTNQASKKHYEENKEIYKDRARKHSKRQIEFNRSKLIEYISDKACVDCGENDPVVLHFDHVRGKKKEIISIMVSQCYSWSTIEKEIAKCELRCANCHMRKTAKQFGWAKAR